jgi:uncharacterized protein (TIGR02466 family)
MDASNNTPEPKGAEPESKDNTSIIKNIIITGGGPAILNSYGALKEAETHGYWNYESVKSFYGTSSGSVLSLMLALGYPLETIGKYLVGRPWKTVFGLGSINFYECFVGNGHLDGNLFYDVFGPLMKGKDMDINITFQQFHEVLGKELYFYTKEILKHNHEFKMTTSRFTRTEKGEESNYHNHRNSYISCVLYIDVNNESGDISFVNYGNNKIFKLTTTEYNIYNSEDIKIRPQKGMIIFFPSEVHHKILANKSNISRSSLACNFIPVGDLQNLDSDSYLNIK